MEFHARIFCRELPIRLGVPSVPFGIPRLALCAERCFVLDTVREALATEMAECDLRHVYPPAMLGRIMDLQVIGDFLASAGSKAS